MGNTENKTDLAPALLALGEKDKQAPKQDNQIFFEGYEGR